jgi:hypothetical protein
LWKRFLFALGRAHVEGIILERDTPNRDFFHGGLAGNALIFFYHREGMGRIEGLDLFQRDRHVPEDLAVEGDGAAENTDELAGELLAIIEGDGVGGFRKGPAGPQQQQST